MTDPVVRIPNWSEFQHYKERNPPWIKLHRKILNKREWHTLSGEAAKLLVELWLIASESQDGTIAEGTGDLAWRVRRDSDLLAKLLVELELHDFLDLSVHDARVVIAGCVQAADPEGEAQLPPETQLQKNTARVFEIAPEYTRGELLEAAKRECGMGLWDRQTESRANSVLVSWTGEGVKPERIWAAIHGARILANAGKVEWLPKGKPFGLHALRNTGTLFDQGDGKAARPFFEVAAEAYYADDSKAVRRPTGGPQRLSVDVPGAIA